MLENTLHIPLFLGNPSSTRILVEIYQSPISTERTESTANDLKIFHRVINKSLYENLASIGEPSYS